MTRKTKLAIGAAAFVLLFPIYALSDPGMARWTQASRDKADAAETPGRLLLLAKIYSATYREEKMEALLQDWLHHYGGDESEKEPGERYDTWTPSPWSPEHPRPAQRGEDYRPTPHPATGTALLMYANELERRRHYLEAEHLWAQAASETYCKRWGIEIDPDVARRAKEGLARHGTGR